MPWALGPERTAAAALRKYLPPPACWPRVILPCLALVSCSAAPAEVVPVVQIPSADSDAYPYAAIDTLELSIAHSGDTEPLALVSGALGETLALSQVGYASDLVVHLSGRSGGSELAYGRTCVFGLQRGEQAAPLLYFARIVRWAAGPPLATARGSRVVGVSLRGSGLVLFWSGDTGGAVDVYDASVASASGPSIRALDAELFPRRGASVAQFGDRILLVGGVSDTGDAAALVEQIVPSETRANNQVLSVAGPALRDHESVSLQDGSVLVTGGQLQSAAGAPFEYSRSATLFSLLSGELVQREIRPGLAIPRVGHSMTRLGNEVGADILIIGGISATGQAIAQAELYRPLRGAFENKDSARLATPRFEHRAVRLPGGFVLIIGGYTFNESGQRVPVRELELYDPVQGVFRSAGILPGSAGVTGMSVTELPDGRFLLAGGDDIDGLKVNTALIASFDPIDGVVDLSPTAPLREVRSHHAAVTLCDGTVLITGGTQGTSTASERYNPPSPGRR